MLKSGVLKSGGWGRGGVGVRGAGVGEFGVGGGSEKLGSGVELWVWSRGGGLGLEELGSVGWD